MQHFRWKTMLTLQNDNRSMTVMVVLASVKLMPKEVSRQGT